MIVITNECQKRGLDLLTTVSVGAALSPVSSCSLEFCEGACVWCECGMSECGERGGSRQ